MKQDELLKTCCCEWQAGSPKWESGATGLRDNCVKLGWDVFGKGDRGVMQMLYAKYAKME